MYNVVCRHANVFGNNIGCMYLYTLYNAFNNTACNNLMKNMFFFLIKNVFLYFLGLGLYLYCGFNGTTI